ncbi:MAG: M48 family metalloprotease [Nanoarchaeota archaeon]
MNEHLERYKKISDSIIKKAFIVLKGRRLIYIERKFKYFGKAINLGFFNVIIINPVLRTFSDKELKGFFAHELSHIQRHQARNLSKKISFIINYLISEKFRRWEEGEADKLTIKKGYGQELYALMRKSYGVSKEHEKRLKSSHLSLKEIKLYIKRNKT